MNRHEFEQAARAFRAGRLTLTDLVALFDAAQQSVQSASRHARTESADTMVAKTGKEEGSLPIRLPTRPADAHKTSCGHVVVMGGSKCMPGAPALAGLAALRTGAGLVTVLTAEEAAVPVASTSPCLMVVPLESDGGFISSVSRHTIADYIKRADTVALGPGIGQSFDLVNICKTLFADVPVPMVVDADGLNNLAAARIDLAAHAGERILTPHLGEFRRLINAPSMDLTGARSQLASFAAEKKLIALIKGLASRITDGSHIFDNPTGNCGMATAGSGDVLTGIIAGLRAQGLCGLEATVSGVYLHGLAGDIALERFGVHSLIATDLIDCLPEAMKRIGTAVSTDNG